MLSQMHVYLADYIVYSACIPAHIDLAVSVELTITVRQQCIQKRCSEGVCVHVSDIKQHLFLSIFTDCVAEGESVLHGSKGS